jgi:hypothetical protein
LWRIDHVPADLRSERLHAVQRLGKPQSSYRKVTLNKEHLSHDAHLDAVLIGPGHPLYAAVDEKLRERLAPLVGGVAFYVDPLAEVPYRLHFFEISIRGKDTKGKDILLHGELVAVREVSGNYEVVQPDMLLNLPPHPKPPQQIDRVDIQAAADFVKSTYQLECRERAQKERERYAAIVREYLEKSFDVRIKKAQERAMFLAAEAVSKPEFKLAADEARRYVEDLERSREERRAGLKRLEIARTGPIQHLGTAIVVLPDSDLSAQQAVFADEPDPLVQRRCELAAEEHVIAALIEEGFPASNIERVGAMKIGFDIRAHRVRDVLTGEIEIRRIEVKGRIRGQPIRLTTNEWYKAQQLGQTYWLYVVWDPLGDAPELVRIHNPAEKLDHAKREIVRFFEIPATAVASAAAS